MALCALLLLAALPAISQGTATVTLFTDTNSTDGSGNPGLGAGYIDSSGHYDLRFALQGAIVTGGKWTINFPSTCTATNPCVITLTNPLPPITSKSTNPLILNIDGGEFGNVIIDGAGAYRAFFIDDANVTLANLQIQNALAQGGAGGEGVWLGGGGGAGLGAGVFVNQSTAKLSVQNTYFLNCQVIGGAGGWGDNYWIGGGAGGGGGMAFNGGNVWYHSFLHLPAYNGGGGGGILSNGADGEIGNGGDGGAGGGGGGGDDTQLDNGWTNGGIAYGDNSAGGQNQDTENGANGGFGGGGGGAGAYISSSLIIYASYGGNGGFGGGGGGGSESGSDSAYGATNLGGFGGGNGGGTYDNVYGGAGGSAYGPSIFNNAGAVTIGNSGYLNDSNHTAAVAGQGASGSGTAAANGSADATAAYNLGGTLNVPLPSALPATHFSVSISPSSFVLNQDATITVTALDYNNNHTIAYNNTANLTATDGDSRPITVSPTSLTFTNGLATSNLLSLSIADTDITVTATDANWAYITGTSTDITVNKITPKVAVTLFSGTSPVFTKNVITFTASVGFGTQSQQAYSRSAQPMGTSGYTLAGPTGTVTFLDGTTALCTNVALGAYNSTTGVATTTCSVNSASAPLSVGTHSITAVYNGDANFSALTSSALTQLVEDFSFSMQNASFTVIPGRAALYTFTVNPVGPATTFPAGISFSVSGLPAGATAVFSPTGTATGAGTTTVTLTIQTLLGNTVVGKMNTGNTLASRLAPFSLALLLLPFVGRLRKAGRRFGRMLPILLLLLLIAGMAAMAGMSGCNSTIGFFGQAQQSYTVGVTGTSGTLSHTSNVTLTVE
jgi:hypothetical protein